MKILLITSIYPTKQHPDYGTFVRNIHKLYERRGHEVTLVAYQRERGKLRKIRNTIHFFKEINWALSKQNCFDGINVHYPFLAAFPIARKLNKIKVPLLITILGTDAYPDSFIKHIAAIPTKMILKRCKRIIVPSDFFKKRMMKTFKMPETHFKVAIPGGFDELVFFPAQEENYVVTQKLADEKINIDEKMKNQKLMKHIPQVINQTASDVKRKYIGFAGRLVAKKGWRTLIAAFASLKDSSDLKDYDLILAGSGTDREEILEKAKELEISERIHLTGALTPQQMGDFYRKLDFLVFPTQFQESLGMVGIEALACGIPVIASATGGVLEYIKQGYNGLLVKPGDVEELRAAILEMSRKNPAEKLRLKAHALESVRIYEETKVAEQLDEMLKEELS